MFKKHMVPLSKGGQTVAHKGKGSQMAAMPDRAEINQLARGPGTINDYAKASPAPQPQPLPAGPMGGFGQGG